ncbi:Prohibitin-4 [Diplonema papillatum]|nr:Prohibitin-4 [Diplonema papillatum]
MDAIMRNVSRLTVAVSLGGFAVSQFCYVLYPGEACIIYDRIDGVQHEVKYEGIHFKVPYLHYPKVYDMRLRPAVIETMTGTKDLQKVHIKLRVLFRPSPSHLGNLYQTLGLDYNERVLPSIGNEIMKAVVAEYNAEELVVKRESVSQAIRKKLAAKAMNDFDIILDDISLMDITFGSEFMAAVEAKQVAQQEAQKFQWVVLRNEQEKLAAITRAEGEAAAAKLISDAVASAGPGLIELRRIEAAKQIAQTLSMSSNVQYVVGGNNLLLGLRGA